MSAKLLAFILAVVFVGVSGAYAHHSFAATYIVDKEVKIEGKLVEFMYRNPHSFVIEVQDDKGQTWPSNGAGEPN